MHGAYAWRVCSRRRYATRLAALAQDGRHHDGALGHHQRRQRGLQRAERVHRRRAHAGLGVLKLREHLRHARRLPRGGERTEDAERRDAHLVRR